MFIFIPGPTAQPKPIKYAKHCAESFSKMIFPSDKTLELDSVRSIIPELTDSREYVRNPKGRR